MRTSLFATYRGRIVRRVLIVAGVMALGLYILAGFSAGASKVSTTERPDDRVLFGGRRAPAVAPPVADPYLVDRSIAPSARSQQGGGDPLEERRRATAIATASAFASAYATYSADDTADHYVDTLPSVSPAFRETLLADVRSRWSDMTRGQTFAAGRVSGIPVEITSFTLTSARVRVQVLQNVSSGGGQRTNTLTYRVDLAWNADVGASQGTPTGGGSSGSAGSGTNTNPSGNTGGATDPGAASPPGGGAAGAWQVVAVTTES